MRVTINLITPVLAAVAFGALCGAGMRGMEWLIPKPEQRIIVCMADELGKAEICRTLDELLERQASRKARGR